MEHGSLYTDSDYWSALEDKREWERTLSELESDVSEIERELCNFSLININIDFRCDIIYIL